MESPSDSRTALLDALDATAQSVALARLHVQAAIRGDVAPDFQTLEMALRKFQSIIRRVQDEFELPIVLEDDHA